jgi:hypothetical protein
LFARLAALDKVGSKPPYDNPAQDFHRERAVIVAPDGRRQPKADMVKRHLLAASCHSLQVHCLYGVCVKVTIRTPVDIRNAAIDLMAASSPHRKSLKLAARAEQKSLQVRRLARCCATEKPAIGAPRSDAGFGNKLVSNIVALSQCNENNLFQFFAFGSGVKSRQ